MNASKRRLLLLPLAAVTLAASCGQESSQSGGSQRPASSAVPTLAEV